MRRAVGCLLFTCENVFANIANVLITHFSILIWFADLKRKLEIWDICGKYVIYEINLIIYML